MGLLSGKIAIITGAGSGIGRASALRFAAEGAKLMLGDKAESVHETAAMVHDEGGIAAAITMDAGLEADVENIVAAALGAYGGIDIAFANAGISGGMTGVFDYAAPDFAEVLRVNLIGPWLMVKHAGKVMVDQGRGGSIILTASVAGIRSGAGGPAYSASKAGVINLAQVSAQQMSATNVRVNAICPGLTETGMTKYTFDFARSRGTEGKLGQLNPLKRAAAPEEIAEVAVQLVAVAHRVAGEQKLLVEARGDGE